MPEETPTNSVPEISKPEITETEKLIKIKTDNDAMEKELARQDYLRAKMELGGRALAGQRAKTPEEEAKEEATKLLKIFGK